MGGSLPGRPAEPSNVVMPSGNVPALVILLGVVLAAILAMVL